MGAYRTIRMQVSAARSVKDMPAAPAIGNADDHSVEATLSGLFAVRDHACSLLYWWEAHTVPLELGCCVE